MVNQLNISMTEQKKVQSNFSFNSPPQMTDINSKTIFDRITTGNPHTPFQHDPKIHKNTAAV